MDNLLIIKTIRDTARGHCRNAENAVTNKLHIGFDGRDHAFDLASSLTKQYSQLREEFLKLVPEYTGLLPVFNHGMSIEDSVTAFRALYNASNNLFFDYTEELQKAVQKAEKFEERLKKLDEDKEILSKMLKRFTDSEEFTLSNEQIERCPEELRDRLIEVSAAFKAGCFISVCAVCGSIIEGILAKEVEKGNYEEKLEELAKLKKIFGGSTKKIAEAQNIYRNLTAHPGKSFGKEEARVSLSLVLILCKELYH